MKEFDKIIKTIMKDVDAGKSMEEIMRKSGLDEIMVRDIVQIYTTHRGIDVQGILDRLDIKGM